MHVPCLAYPMAPILCLGIHGRVPVAVIEHHSVSPCQVHPQPPRPRGQDETEDTLIHVEPLHQGLPLFHFSGTVQAQVAVAVVVEESF